MDGSRRAAVDCSVPVSVRTSIKYADQQRKKKLKKELARCEKEFKLSKYAMQSNSKMNTKSLYNSFQKPAGEPQGQDMLIEEVTRYPSFSKSFIPSSDGLHLSQPELNKILLNGTQKHPSTSPPSMAYVGSATRSPYAGHGCDRRPRSAFPSTHRFHLVISKTPSGDLLEKHSDLFSNKQLPFTPRTLKTEAKSFLSQYRYYTPARRRKEFPDERMEAETQTELSSFNSESGTVETKDSEVNLTQVPNYMTNDAEDQISPLPSQEENVDWVGIQDGTLQRSSETTLCELSTQLSSDSKIYSE